MIFKFNILYNTCIKMCHHFIQKCMLNIHYGKWGRGVIYDNVHGSVLKHVNMNIV
jgi:hypothetical protein